MEAVVFQLSHTCGSGDLIKTSIFAVVVRLLNDGIMKERKKRKEKERKESFLLPLLRLLNANFSLL